MTGRDVEREVESRIHKLKVAINRWEHEEGSDEEYTECQTEMLNRWHSRRHALEDLLNWYRAEMSRRNRKAGKFDEI